jgi:hypothetical protein
MLQVGHSLGLALLPIQGAGLLNNLFAPTPFILQSGIKAQCIDIFWPPLTPTSQENLIWVNRDVGDSECTE